MNGGEDEAEGVFDRDMFADNTALPERVSLFS